jgi:hypothetical protein
LSSPPPPQNDIDERRMYFSNRIHFEIFLLEISPTLIDQKEQTTLFSLDAKKMATTATLTAVSAAGTTSNTDTNKRKSEETITRKPTHRRLSNQDTTKMKSSIDLDDNDGLNKTKTSATFRIPKIGR